MRPPYDSDEDRDDVGHDDTVQMVMGVTLGLVLLGALLSWWGG